MDTETRKRLVRRLQIVEGHVRAIQRMVDEGAYCIDTIKQICATGAQNLIWIRLHGTYLDGNDGFTAKPKAACKTSTAAPACCCWA